MKHVRSTSKSAYHNIREKGTIGNQQRRILYVLESSHRAMSLREISRATYIEINAVSARVNELKKDGLLFEHTKRKCSITKITIIPVSTREQMSLSFSS